MTIKELKDIIRELPDDMKVFVDLDLEPYDPRDGCASANLSAEEWNNYLYITAKFD